MISTQLLCENHPHKELPIHLYKNSMLSRIFVQAREVLKGRAMSTLKLPDIDWDFGDLEPDLSGDHGAAAQAPQRVRDERQFGNGEAC